MKSVQRQLILAALATATAFANAQTTVSFRDGTDGYTGTQDTWIQSNLPTDLTKGTSGAVLFTDWPDGASQNWTHQTLLKFGDIIGAGTGQIPAGAKILKAVLVLNTLSTGTGSSSNAPGDGGEMHRMLVDWDETTATWDVLVNGVDLDDIDARTSKSRLIGIDFLNGAETTGVGAGPLPLDVTADVQAWADGASNFGWVIHPHVGGSDGWAWAPSENVLETARPQLLVSYTMGALPYQFQTVLQDGLNGYAGTADTMLSEDNATTNFGGAERMLVDYTSTGSGLYSHSLIRFDEIFGTATNQVPADAYILKATLNFSSFGSDAQGDGGRLHRMLLPWDEFTATWLDNFAGNGLQNDGSEAAIDYFAQAGLPARTPDVPYGDTDIDVTTDLRAWQAGEANNGWAMIPWDLGTNAWIPIQSDCLEQSLRPKLTIEWGYYPVVRGQVTLLDFDAATAGRTVAIQLSQAGTVIHGGTATLDSTGNYSFVVTNPFTAGNYDVRIKSSHWLAKATAGVNITASGATGVSVSLINGDIDDDNEVGIGDYAQLSAAYGSIVGDANFSAAADLNGDESVDIGDYAVLSANYGLTGD